MSPDKEQIAAAWDVQARPADLDPARIAYGSRPFTVLELFYAELLDSLPAAERGLEIGCGDCHNLVRLIEGGRIERAVGIDISAGAIEGAEARRRELGFEDRLDLRLMDYEEYEPDGAFGTVLAIQVVNYVGDLGDLFARVRPWLAPGGTLLVVDGQRPLPPKDWVMWKLVPVVRRLRGKPPADFGLAYHRARDVESQARAAGFEPTLARGAWGPLGSIFARPLYRAAMHRFKREWTRRLVRRAYLLVRPLYAAAHRRKRRGQALYALGLRATAQPTETETGAGTSPST